MDQKISNCQKNDFMSREFLSTKTFKIVKKLKSAKKMILWAAGAAAGGATAAAVGAGWTPTSSQKFYFFIFLFSFYVFFSVTRRSRSDSRYSLTKR